MTNTPQPLCSTYSRANCHAIFVLPDDFGPTRIRLAKDREDQYRTAGRWSYAVRFCKERERERSRLKSLLPGAVDVGIRRGEQIAEQGHPNLQT